MQDRVDDLARPVGRTTTAAGSSSSQALFALATGGILGTGLGPGGPTDPRRVETDFIFAAIGEELGLLGATAMLLVATC